MPPVAAEVVAPEDEEEPLPLFDDDDDEEAAPLSEFSSGVPDPEKEACVISSENPLYKVC